MAHRILRQREGALGQHFKCRYGLQRRLNLINILTDSPLPEMYAPTDEMMSYALGATAKQQEDESKPKPKRKGKKRKRKAGNDKIIKAEKPLAQVQSERAVENLEFIDVAESLSNGTILGKYAYFKSFIESNVKFVGDPNSLVMQNREGLINRLAWLVGLKSCSDVFKSFSIALNSFLIAADFSWWTSKARNKGLAEQRETIYFRLASVQIIRAEAIKIFINFLLFG